MSEAAKKILLIEDDESMVAALRLYLEELGHGFEHAANGKLGAARALSGEFALIILDLGLPDISGMDVCRELREKRVLTPILMLTSRSGEMDKYLGFETGADDYVTKPFSVLELVSRVKALLRRSSGEFLVQSSSEPEELRAGGFVLNRVKRTAHAAGKVLELTALEFDLFWLLIKNSGQVFTKEELLETVWGYKAAGYDSTVTTHISRLRKKVEPNPDDPVFIKTVWGRGYKFLLPE